MSKYALITGGAKGIGFSAATRLAKMGYNLLLTYRSDTIHAQQACAELCDKYQVETTAIRADSSDIQSIDTVLNEVVSRDIRLDVVLFNAGMTCRDPFEEMKMADWERVFFANIHFPVFLLQRLLGRINSGGCVIFTGSLMGILPHAQSLSYGVTKAAIHALAKNLVKFLKPYQIRVNAVAPGFVDTGWHTNKPAEIRQNIEDKIAAGRFCDPDEIAGVYQLLIENQYVNGEIIVVDGGYSYQ
jgi:3-oxoacyl-[acyl-carrier protein] reductase